MIFKILFTLIIMSMVLPLGAMVLRKNKTERFAKTTLLVNLFSFFSLLALANLYIFGTSMTAFAAENAADIAFTTGYGLRAIGAGISTGLASLGAGIGAGIGGSSAIGAISEDPQVMGKALIFVVLAEGVGIYGLLISFMILM